MHNFNVLKNSLISEAIIVPTIKYLNFTSEEIQEYKDLDEINTIKLLSESEQINLNDIIKTEWNKIYKVTDIQLLNELEDYQYLNLLSTKRIQELSKVSGGFKAITLERIIKQNDKRYFYDCEFDESPEYGINLISIGIVDEDGNELYLINKNYNWNACTNKWLIKHVYPYIKNSPDYYKVSIDEIPNKILNFISSDPRDNIKLYRILFCI